ncbi:hypothetical protein IWW36_001191 [Coemansia brasiliensis]|uniref:Uncharacterized protein n=1 Tax=Coemansia brasiliensis TaxID=2650707 RepID=A0A9W8M268_9FUNG|nr:hypothetical protein IWW36_001191 [Coemansia brasiliensis]
MDFRDKDGYFQQDVLQVLGRSSLTESSIDDKAGLGQSSTLLGEPAYGSLRSGNFDASSTTSSSTSESTEDSSIADSEWEDTKRLLYTALVGTLLPLVFRYVGRRTTFSMWTQFLHSYFKS